jgi:ubiquinone/menaquinone biosynthesis C-methylase UbiE
VHELVQRAYGSVAREQSGCCGGGCCGAEAALGNVPVPEAELGLSCGNPLAFSLIKAGDTVLDLGSGAGKDVFTAALAAGSQGHVIGVDMTPEMISLAQRNALKFAARTGFTNVEFRTGQIESLPVDDSSVDLVISNCVINLSTDKPQVFREAFRVLRPGGQLVLSDIVLERELPAEIAADELQYANCISGALLRSDYLAAIKAAGFASVEIAEDRRYESEGCACTDPVTTDIAAQLEHYASSITVKAHKA